MEGRRGGGREGGGEAGVDGVTFYEYDRVGDIYLFRCPMETTHHTSHHKKSKATQHCFLSFFLSFCSAPSSPSS